LPENERQLRSKRFRHSSRPGIRGNVSRHRQPCFGSLAVALGGAFLVLGKKAPQQPIG
jgi:hypothetical protein